MDRVASRRLRAIEARSELVRHYVTRISARAIPWAEAHGYQ